MDGRAEGVGGDDVSDDCRDEVRAVFCRWKATEHLGAKLKLMQFENMRGEVETGVETGSLIEVLEEFVKITNGLRRAPVEMREIKKRALSMLPTLRAFHADPHTVMDSGVN